MSTKLTVITEISNNFASVHNARTATMLYIVDHKNVTLDIRS